MKILFILGEFPKLSETFVLNQITGLIKSGIKVSIIAYKGEKNNIIHNDFKKFDLQSKTIYYGKGNKKISKFIFLCFAAIRYFVWKILRIDKSNRIRIIDIIKFPNLLLLIPAIQKLENKKYDAIIAHFGMNGLIMNKIINLGYINGKLFTIFHGFDITLYVNQKGKDIYNELFDSDCILLPISNYWAKKLIKLGANCSQIFVHHMGTDLTKFQFYPPIRNNVINILTVARLVEKKGLEYALLAVTELVNKGYQIKYTIIGRGPLENKLKEIANINKLSAIIDFQGWKTQEEVIDLTKESQIILLPSVTSKNGDMEGIPVSLMEAMAMGKIVVSTYHSGIPELITEGVDGFLVNEKDVIGLANKIEYIIRNKKNWIDIGKNARIKIEKNFNIKQLNKDLIYLISSNK